MDIVSEAIKNILGCAEVVLVMWGVLCCDIEKNKLNRIAASVLLVIEVSLAHVFPCDYFIKILFTSIINAIIIIVLFQGRYVNKFIKIIFTILSVELCSDGFSIFFDMIPIIKVRDCNNIIANAIMLLILSICVRSIRKNINYQTTIKSINSYFFLIWNVIFALVSIAVAIIKVYESNWNVQTVYFAEAVRILLSFSIFILFSLFVGIEMRKQQFEEENNLKDEYLRLSKQHYESLEWQIKETRKIKHDVMAHYSVLKKLIDDKNVDGASSYLNEMHEHFDGMLVNSIKTGNELVDAVLNDTIKKYPDVKVVFTGSIENCILSDYDLCTVFSNLFNNAVEATEKLNHKEKIININVKYYNDTMMIGIKNPIEKMVDIKHLGSYTTKEDSFMHGIGIDNVKHILESYKATIDFSTDDGSFNVMVQISET